MNELTAVDRRFPASVADTATMLIPCRAVVAGNSAASCGSPSTSTSSGASPVTVAVTGTSCPIPVSQDPSTGAEIATCGMHSCVHSGSKLHSPLTRHLSKVHGSPSSQSHSVSGPSVASDASAAAASTGTVSGSSSHPTRATIAKRTTADGLIPTAKQHNRVGWSRARF